MKVQSLLFGVYAHVSWLNSIPTLPVYPPKRYTVPGCAAAVCPNRDVNAESTATLEKHLLSMLYAHISASAPFATVRPPCTYMKPSPGAAAAWSCRATAFEAVAKCHTLSCDASPRPSHQTSP